MNNTLLVGCSFTDPTWQSAIPWSVQYSSLDPCYISAKAGMGIKGICIEALYRLLELPDVKKNNRSTTKFMANGYRDGYRNLPM